MLISDLKHWSGLRLILLIVTLPRAAHTQEVKGGVAFLFIVVIITTMNSKQVIKQLEANGWFLVRVNGSHHQFKHATKSGLVTVKHPDSDIPAGTLNSIRKQAEWK